MKTKYVYATTAVLCFFVLIVIFKLNDYYKNEKKQTIENQMSQRNLSLKTSIATQLGQLKNILSAYTYRIDESKLNWSQMDPLTVMAQTHISKTGQFEVKNIFTKSGSKTERWTKEFLQKALTLRKYSGKGIHVDLFTTVAGDKYISLSFVVLPTSSGSEAVTVVGDANYFQKFFDLNRSRKVVHLLMTDSKAVAGHTESEYVTSVTAEAELSPKNYFVEIDELRSSNLKIISYASKNKVFSLMNIPTVLLGLILGFACLLVGILFYALRPIEKMVQLQKDYQRENVYKKALAENLAQDQAPKIIRSEEVLLNLNIKPVAKADAALPLPPDLVIQQVVQAPQIISEKEFQVFDQAADIKNSVSEVLSETVKSMENIFLAEGISIHQDIKSENKFDFDRNRFFKMFEHILKNSVEAVRQVSKKNISIRSFDQGRSATVEIYDSGTGVSEELVDKIWQPYFTTKAKNKNQGLGLSEALSIARRYDSDLTFRNHSSGGAVVQLTVGGDVVLDEKTDVQSVTLKDLNEDIDLDRLLDLESDTDLMEIQKVSPQIDLKKEFTTTQFKIDTRIEIVADPDIQIETVNKPMDAFKVHIRGPQKS